ncbi:MAG: PRC-barrel domain-containing protein [Magnetospirillum sp.]|nr:PRC-barrel domain-containing protein [Magnetospirillum sp.]
MMHRIVTTMAVALALTGPALAQQAQSPSDDRAQSRSSQDIDDRPLNQLSMAQADKIQGAKVHSPQGETIGDIRDLVVDMKSGQVAFAIVGVGGFLGVGEKNVAVPWERLQAANQPETFTLNADRQTLAQAPSLPADEALDNPQARQRISAFWEGAPTQQAQTPEEQQRQQQQQK